MPPPVGLINLSAGELIAAAGGDPWQINDELHAGDAGAINAQADAYHAAASSATEVEDDFTSAKQRFEQGWRHNGVENPINDAAEVARATAGMNLQKSQLATIALDLETVAAALATAQRACDAHIAALDTFLHGIDDAIGAAGAVAGGTAEGVRQTTLKLITESPGTGPGKADPGLLKWLQDPTIGGVELKGFSRLGGVVAAAGAVPAVMSDIHDGNSVPEAVTREAGGTAVGLYAGGLAAGLFADAGAGAAIGSVVPGAGTAVGLVVGAGVGALAAVGASKGIEAIWDPISDVVASATHNVESVFGFG